MSQRPVVLASASPRRRELLSGAGIEFSIRASNVDESLAGGVGPEAACSILAERKARAVAAELGDADVLVIGADTVVAVRAGDGARILGKPADATEAGAMLADLSDSRHRVVTGVCVVHPRSGRSVAAWERTWVTMRTIEPGEIEAYVRSGEWRDKAGGYAIQEHADAFVTGLEEGGFDNVVGLPVGLTLALLERLGT